MPHVRANGVRLYYSDRGSGEPVVLLHGFTTTHVGNWDRRGWIDMLARSGFRVLALDFRSHGRSDRVYEPSEAATARLTADVVALLDHTAVARADLIGFSMGGGVALDVAMTNPERVRRLVVAGVADAALNEFHDPSEVTGILAAFEGASGAAASPAGQRLRRNAELAGNDINALTPFLRNGGWPGVLSPERPVEAPVLLIVAEEDQYMHKVEKILRWLPLAQVLRVLGRDHHSVLDDENVRAAVLAFLGAGTAASR